MEAVEEQLPFCNVCLGSSDPNYMDYNMVVSGVVLPVVGFIGLIGNMLVMLVYGSAEQRIHSTSIYLAALALSDFLMITTALVLYVLEAWRHQGLNAIALLYARSAPYVFPMSTVLQTTSVYFCVAAAADCFIAIVLPPRFKNHLCTSKQARTTVLWIAGLSLLYNVPHVFELESVDCIDERHESAPSAQICPTEFRTNELYYQLYYTYMYTIFMAVGPLIVIVILNVCVVYAVFKKGDSGDSDTVSLILVVFMFIFCNAAALLVNFIELVFAEKIFHILVYLVDMSNLLVVINCTGNFFCYLFFGNSFRRTLRQILFGRRVKADLLWAQSETLIVTQKGDSAFVQRQMI